MAIGVPVIGSAPPARISTCAKPAPPPIQSLTNMEPDNTTWPAPVSVNDWVRVRVPGLKESLTAYFVPLFGPTVGLPDSGAAGASVTNHPSYWSAPVTI